MQGELPPGLVLITIPQFMRKLGITSEPHFHELRKKDPRFPRALRRGRRWTRFVLSEADDYLKLHHRPMVGEKMPLIPDTYPKTKAAVEDCEKLPTDSHKYGYMISVAQALEEQLASALEYGHKHRLEVALAKQSARPEASFRATLQEIVLRSEHCGGHAGVTATRQAMLDMARLAHAALTSTPQPQRPEGG